MATTSTPVESINGKTARHSLGIHKARMEAVRIVAADPYNPLLFAWNDLNEHVNELLELQRAQIRYLEALCRHRDSVREHANQIRVAS